MVPDKPRYSAPAPAAPARVQLADPGLIKGDLMPAATQLECEGSVTASNRSIQWGEKIVEPVFESKDDYEIMYLLSKKLGLSEKRPRKFAVASFQSRWSPPQILIR